MFNVQRLHHRGVACGTEDGTDDVTEDLEDCLDCLVHSITFFWGLITRVNCVCFIVLDYLLTTIQRYEKNPRYANIPAFFLPLWNNNLPRNFLAVELRFSWLSLHHHTPHLVQRHEAVSPGCHGDGSIGEALIWDYSHQKEYKSNEKTPAFRHF